MISSYAMQLSLSSNISIIPIDGNSVEKFLVYVRGEIKKNKVKHCESAF